MRIVGKFKEKSIILSIFHMKETYGDFLVGPSRSVMEECNRRILEDLEGRMSTRLFRVSEEMKVLLIGKESFNLKEGLPAVVCLGYLSCGETVRQKDYDGSHLVVVWFQCLEDDPFERLRELIQGVDWEATAEDFMY